MLNSVVWWVAGSFFEYYSLFNESTFEARTEGGVSSLRAAFERDGKLEDALSDLTAQIVEIMVILWAGATGTRASAELYATDLSLKYK